MHSHSGEMLEWLKRHAWKACIRQNRISGSNPDLSATKKRLHSFGMRLFLHLRLQARLQSRRCGKAMICSAYQPFCPSRSSLLQGPRGERYGNAQPSRASTIPMRERGGSSGFKLACKAEGAEKPRYAPHISRFVPAVPPCCKGPAASDTGMRSPSGRAQSRWGSVAGLSASSSLAKPKARNEEEKWEFVVLFSTPQPFGFFWNN